MRQDMKRVLVDVPRGGSHLPNKQTRERIRHNGLGRVLSDSDELDLGPARVAMSIGGKLGSHYGGKDKSARLRPLERFLKSKVGQNWNTVHSELSHGLGSKTMVWGKMTIMEQVEDLVDLHCYIGVDDKAYVIERKGGYKVKGLYVHPKTGLLSFQEGTKWVSNKKKNVFLEALRKFGLLGKYEQESEKTKNFRVISNEIALELKGGSWFIHTFTPYLPDDVVSHETFYDAKKKEMVKRPVLFKFAKGHKPFRLVSTRQMGKKELRQYKIEIANLPY